MRSVTISGTYKKKDGYALIFAYIGAEWYLIACGLREENSTVRKGHPAFCPAGSVTKSVTAAKISSAVKSFHDFGIKDALIKEALIKNFNLSSQEADAYL